MTPADDLVRARASVHESERIPVKRFGEIPRMAEPAPLPAQAPASRLRTVAGTVCWLLLAAFAVGLVVRFGH